MEKNKKYTDLPESIMDLTDAEFLSFLYSERDREERLSRWQGWNNWALAGAFVAVIWTANSIWNDHYYVEGYDVMYFTSGIMAISLLLYSCMIFLKRERGIDFSKMKWFKEVFPRHLVLIALGCSIVFSLLILKKDGYCNLFWLWSILGIIVVLSIGSLLFYRNKVMPAYDDGFMFPWVKVNICYNAVMASFYGPIALLSFKKVSSDLLSNEFQIAACISICIALFYIFLKLYSDDKPAKRLDIIIDDYIYNGVTKEKTIREVVKNRMGYSVMDVCYNNLTEIIDLMLECEDDYKKLVGIKEAVEEGECVIAQFNKLQNETKVFYDKLSKVSKKGLMLSDKLVEIQKVAMGWNNIAAMKAIVNKNKEVMDRINFMMDKVHEIVDFFQKRINELKANGGCRKD